MNRRPALLRSRADDAGWVHIPDTSTGQIARPSSTKDADTTIQLADAALCIYLRAQSCLRISIGSSSNLENTPGKGREFSW